MHAAASKMPAPPPNTASTALSVRNRRTRSARDAPRANCVEISRMRDVACGHHEASHVCASHHQHQHHEDHEDKARRCSTVLQTAAHLRSNDCNRVLVAFWIVALETTHDDVHLGLGLDNRNSGLQTT